MSAKWEKQEGNEGVLTFEVEPEEFDNGLDQAFKKVVKDVELPGFRKGRVPRMIFDNRFGVESLYQDAVDILLPEAYSKAVDEAGIEPVDQPEVDIEQIEKGKDLIFTAKVTVKPEVKLGEYKDLEVEEKDATVTDEEVDEAINSLQEQHAELVVKEAGEIENGDTAVIDFEGFIDGEPFEGGNAEEHSLEIGSGQFIPGFEEKLVGKAIDADTEVEVTFPDDYQAEELAGKVATFKVKVHEVKSKELPELDDAFAKDVDDNVETLEELKTNKKEELQSQKEQDNDTQKRQTVIEKASENAEVDIPDAMVDTETDRMIQEFEQQLQQQGMTKEMYFQFSGQDETALKDQMKDDANKRVKTNLTLEAIATTEDVQADDDDVNKELERTASMYDIEIDQLKSMLGENTEAIKEDLKLQKTIDFLVEHSKTV